MVKSKKSTKSLHPNIQYTYVELHTCCLPHSLLSLFSWNISFQTFSSEFFSFILEYPPRLSFPPLSLSPHLSLLPVSFSSPLLSNYTISLSLLPPLCFLSISLSFSLPPSHLLFCCLSLICFLYFCLSPLTLTPSFLSPIIFLPPCSSFYQTTWSLHAYPFLKFLFMP